MRIVTGLSLLPATERTACQHPLEWQLASLHGQSLPKRDVRVTFYPSISDMILRRVGTTRMGHNKTPLSLVARVEYL